MLNAPNGWRSKFCSASLLNKTVKSPPLFHPIFRNYPDSPQIGGLNSVRLLYHPMNTALCISAYIKKLNKILCKYNFGKTVTAEDFMFLSEIVTDDPKGQTFSSHFTSKIWQRIGGGEFYHYAPKHAALGILSSKALRLTSIQKRITEDEIKSFLEKFKYTYPLEIDTLTNKPKYQSSIAEEIYYTSLTKTDLTYEQESYFWNTFARCDGARFKFRLSTKIGCFRNIAYGDTVDHWASLLEEVCNMTKDKLKKEFIWGDAGTACALHLPAKYGIESETRFIIRPSWGLPIIKGDGPYPYQQLFFGDNPKIETSLHLMEVQSDNRLCVPCDVNIIPRS